jgi:hypothetical protein
MDADAIDVMPTDTRPLLMIWYPFLKGVSLTDIEQVVSAFASRIDYPFGEDIDSSHSLKTGVTGINRKAVRVLLSIESCDLGHSDLRIKLRELKHPLNIVHIPCHGMPKNGESEGEPRQSRS